MLSVSHLNQNGKEVFVLWRATFGTWIFPVQIQTIKSMLTEQRYNWWDECLAICWRWYHCSKSRRHTLFLDSIVFNVHWHVPLFYFHRTSWTIVRNWQDPAPTPLINNNRKCSICFQVQPNIFRVSREIYMSQFTL